MSCRRTYTQYVPVEDIKIDVVTCENLSTIETTATDAITQKLEKLNVILRNVSVYCVDNVLLVNDRYGICQDLTEIAQAYGFEIKQIDCGLRGKTYILQDKLIELI